VQAGDLLIVDNHRVLHGRRGFEDTRESGQQARWVQGCYIDKDSTTSKYWVLTKKLAQNVIDRRSTLLTAKIL
jgi:hypothetical protein